MPCSNLSGLLINHNEAWGYPLPTPDNFVHVLGMALQDEFPPLPKVRKKFDWKICSQTNLIQSIQDAVDSAEEGVILFSLGFSFIPDRLPKAQVRSVYSDSLRISSSRSEDMAPSSS